MVGDSWLLTDGWWLIIDDTWLLTWDRTKYKLWLKKLDKMEDLGIDFEMKAAEDEKLKPFLEEVSTRFQAMLAFKKQFLSFEKSVEQYLNKVFAVDCLVI